VRGLRINCSTYKSSYQNLTVARVRPASNLGTPMRKAFTFRAGDGGHSRLFSASLRRTHDIAGDADDAVLLAEQVEGLDGLFGEADNSARRKHRDTRAEPESQVTPSSRRLSSRFIAKPRQQVKPVQPARDGRVRHRLPISISPSSKISRRSAVTAGPEREPS